jgi:site-specific recombinase XerD
LLDSIDPSTHSGLRDRALIALMVYSFARIGAAVAVEDVYVQDHRFWVRLHEKGGKHHEMPCHHNLETYLHDYLEGTGISSDRKSPLFRTIARETTGAGELSRRRMSFLFNRLADATMVVQPQGETLEENTIYVGLDVHKASISVTSAEDGRNGPRLFRLTAP